MTNPPHHWHSRHYYDEPWESVPREHGSEIALFGVVFDNVSYDAAGDILHCRVGAPRAGTLMRESVEGHKLYYEAPGPSLANLGRLVEVRIVGARRIAARDGYITITPLAPSTRIIAKAIERLTGEPLL